MPKNNGIRKAIFAYANEVQTGARSTLPDITLGMLEIFRELIENVDGWQTLEELHKLVRVQYRLLNELLPAHCYSLNIARHVLKLIRNVGSNESQTPAMIDENSNNACKLWKRQELPKDTALLDLLEALDIVRNEIEDSTEQICEKAEQHIHAYESILTFGHSPNVEHFLKRVIERREGLSIIVAECAPSLSGHKMARRLASSRCEVVCIPDSNIFAVMSRVNIVILGTECILANGGLRAVCGTQSVALAAKFNTVPVTVLASKFELSPFFKDDFVDFHGLAAPDEPNAAANALCPQYDYVAPELVKSFVLDSGDYTPSSIYKEFNDLYHPDDLKL